MDPEKETSDECAGPAETTDRAPRGIVTDQEQGTDSTLAHGPCRPVSPPRGRLREVSWKSSLEPSHDDPTDDS